MSRSYNKKELYARRQYTARRGGYKKRVLVPLFMLQKKRRELVPKYSKWGDLSQVGGENHLDEYILHKTDTRKEGHKEQRQASTLNKNYRRTQNPIKDRRKYWKKEREEL